MNTDRRDKILYPVDRNGAELVSNHCFHPDPSVFSKERHEASAKQVFQSSLTTIVPLALNRQENRNHVSAQFSRSAYSIDFNVFGIIKFYTLMAFRLLLIIVFLFGPVFLLAQDGDGDSFAPFTLPPEKANPVVIPRFDSAPEIDGKLDEELWKKAATFKDFIQTRPGDNIRPSKPTIAYMGYDEKYLYLGFYCYDEPDKIRATLAKRDDVGGEDNIRVFLDTFDDQRRAYVLIFNPLGIQGDGIMTEGQMGQGDLSLDIVMESKGAILADGWSVEAKIPFKSLRYAAGKGKNWGFNVWREIDRLNEEVDSWMPIKRDIPTLRQSGKITGFEDIKSERTLEIVPSVTLSQSSERVETLVPPDFSKMLNRPVKPDFGVSVKYQLTPNVTLDAAINPDFAEVEADAPVVTANERFPIFFPEKRPFFLEGIDYFRTPLQVVNTRNIADPDVALKLTGKTGKNTFGLLTAVDRFPDTDYRAYIGVLRLKRDIGSQSNIGIIATTYHFGSQRHNNLFGIDGKFQLNENANINFQVVGTNSRRTFFNISNDSSEYRTGNGIAYQANYDYTGRNRGLFFGINGRSRDYRADVGFTRRTNTHGLNLGFRLGTSPKPDNKLINIVTRHFSGINIDEKGRIIDARYNLNANFNFQKQLRIEVQSGFGIERIYEDEFIKLVRSVADGSFVGRPNRGTFEYFAELEIDKSFSKRVQVSAEIGFRQNGFDLDFGVNENYPRVSPAFLSNPNERNLDPGKALSIGYSFGVDLTPTDPLTIELSYERNKLTRNDNKRTAFDSNIFSLRSTYQFTRFTFFRARWDYDTVDAGIRGQLLFGWSPNPGTAFYAGYNDDLKYRGFNDFTNGFDTGLRRDGRTFFIRMSYLFRKSF
jgi:hypothetical protein